MRAKLLLATAHHHIGNEEDVVVVRRGSTGSQCYSTMTNADTMFLLAAVAQTLCESAIKDKPDA